MRPDGVEVPQQDDAPLGLRDVEVAEHVLDDQLGAAVGADRLQRVGLVQRHVLRVAVHRARAGEHHLRRATAVTGAAAGA